MCLRRVCFGSPLEFFRADIAQRCVPSFSIIEHFDVPEHILFRLGAIFVNPFSDVLGFQFTKETFHAGVVPGVALAAHAATDVVGGQDALQFFRCVLHAPIAVVR